MKIPKNLKIKNDESRMVEFLDVATGSELKCVMKTGWLLFVTRWTISG